jgi:hypothetical protein
MAKKMSYDAWVLAVDHAIEILADDEKTMNGTVKKILVDQKEDARELRAAKKVVADAKKKLSAAKKASHEPKPKKSTAR